jgi:hypothetical protein
VEIFFYAPTILVYLCRLAGRSDIGWLECFGILLSLGAAFRLCARSCLPGTLANGATQPDEMAKHSNRSDFDDPSAACRDCQQPCKQQESPQKLQAECGPAIRRRLILRQAAIVDDANTKGNLVCAGCVQPDKRRRKGAPRGKYRRLGTWVRKNEEER